MRHLKLMADYQCFPLWETTGNTFKNLDPNELSISQELKQDLNIWATKYNSTLNLDDPINSGFKSEEDEKQFKTEAKDLPKRLTQELGKTFTIDLFQET